MENLLLDLAKGLVQKPEEVKVKVCVNNQGVKIYHLCVAKEDMGRVIGKQGRISNAIRTIMKSMAARQRTKIVVEID